MNAFDAPFILLDDARSKGAVPARLYTQPVDVLVAYDADQLRDLLIKLDDAKLRGLHAAGFFSYEAGFALEPRLAHRLNTAALTAPLAWFGLFPDYREIAAGELAALLPDSAECQHHHLQPVIDRERYATAFGQIKDYIGAGDIYQANLTFRATMASQGDPMALYSLIRPRAAAGYGGALSTGEDIILSFSPELFFALKNGRVTTKPMKGTAVRDADPARDRALADALQADPKQRAENLMIVDLLRNDLSRVAIAGSVAVPDLFAIESYPTVHQMISTITAELKPGLGAVDLIRALYPCGSITGAPKIRAMEIIDTLEHASRGPYCGSMGRIDANGDAAFNVAIRSFHLKPSKKPGSWAEATLGLGSGIVSDSVLETEWAECLAKGEFARGGAATV